MVCGALSNALGRRHLALVDNLPLALSAGKGRARSHLLLRPLRRIAGLLLASRCRLSVRWIPSELNSADAPSRGFGRWVSAQVAEARQQGAFRPPPLALALSSSTQACS